MLTDVDVDVIRYERRQTAALVTVSRQVHGCRSSVNPLTAGCHFLQVPGVRQLRLLLTAGCLSRHTPAIRL